MTAFDPAIVHTSPQIPRAEVKLLWHCDFWDGPINGLLLHRGELCWFEMVAENEDDDEKWHRRFAVVHLTPEQVADELYWHELFQTHVGGHTDYSDGVLRTPIAALPKDGWNQFYDKYKERVKPEYSANAIVGWFAT